MAYADLRQFLQTLEARRMLYWIGAEVDKDWEVSCITRAVFHGFPDEKRFAVGFRNLRGLAGASFVTGAIGASRLHIQAALGLQLDHLRDEEILHCMSDGLSRPIQPCLVRNGPCQEVFLTGKDVDISRIPAPVWTPGKDPGPYFTPLWITKDPETGKRNVGIYRSQILGPRQVTVWTLQNAAQNIAKWFARGQPCPAALVLGADPLIYLAAAAKFSYGYDEMDAAGGLRREAIELVPCKTIPMEVPACSELVIEGEFDPEARVQEGPFGEWTGYMTCSSVPTPVFHVKAITHRPNPIVLGLSAQFPLCENTFIIQASQEAGLFKHLRYDLGFDWVLDFHQPSSASAIGWTWIKIRKSNATQVEKVTSAIIAHRGPGAGKWLVVCDEDVDIRNPSAREWVLAFRVNPGRDVRILDPVEALALDPSSAPPEEARPTGRIGLTNGRIIVDATCKWKYPEISLPPRDLLEKVQAKWKEYALPPLGDLTFPCSY